VPLTIRLLTPLDIRAASRHVERHAQESGRGGDAIFAPFLEFDRETYELGRGESWRRGLDMPGWERCWGAFDQERVVGHVDLTGGTLYASLHRTRLGIGVERVYRGTGTGTALLEVALAWARAEAQLTWVDLSVFAHNLRAQTLYERYGFRECGRVPDAYRIKGTRIDDVHMSLSVA